MCLAPSFVKCSWTSLFSSASILQITFVAYPEVLGWAIGEEIFGKLAGVINFRVFGDKNLSRNVESVARGCL